MSISVAQHFTKLGLKQCDIIGICASNTDFLAPLVFGAIFNGLTISTLDVSYEKEGIQHAFGMTKPKMMFCDGDIYHRVRGTLEACGLDIQIFTLKVQLAGVPYISEFLEHRTSQLAYA